MAMREREVHEVASTYRRRELGDDGNQEPGDTLTNGNMSVNREQGSREEGLTWFHKKCPKAIVPPPGRRTRDRPTSMVESKIISATSAAIVLSLMLSRSETTQFLWPNVARNYR
jgi:hypothetical protein